MRSVWCWMCDVECVMSSLRYWVCDVKCEILIVWWEVCDVMMLNGWCWVCDVKCEMLSVWWEMCDVECVMLSVSCWVWDIEWRESAGGGGEGGGMQAKNKNSTIECGENLLVGLWTSGLGFRCLSLCCLISSRKGWANLLLTNLQTSLLIAVAGKKNEWLHEHKPAIAQDGHKNHETVCPHACHAIKKPKCPKEAQNSLNAWSSPISQKKEILWDI